MMLAMLQKPTFFLKQWKKFLCQSSYTCMIMVVMKLIANSCGCYAKSKFFSVSSFCNCLFKLYIIYISGAIIAQFDIDTIEW